MKDKTLRGLVLVLAALLPLMLAACERDPIAGHDRELERVEIIDRQAADQPLVAVWAEATGWTGALPVIQLGSPTARAHLGVRMFAGGAEVALSAAGPYSAQWTLAPNATQGVVATDDARGPRFLGDGVAIHGVAPGSTSIQFQLWHFDHADGATDPIAIQVSP